MSFHISIEPSGRTFQSTGADSLLQDAIAQGIPLPYGCKDGACGSCKCLKLSGEVHLDSHQANALSEEEAAAGYILTCRSHAKSDLVLESKQVSSEHMFPVRKMPARVASLEKLSPDVMRVMLQLPASESFYYHPGQYIDLILRDGARRSYSMASRCQIGQQLELHIRHMLGGKFTEHVFGALKEKELLRVEGPMGSFYLRNSDADQLKPMVLLASGTGFAPIKAVLEQMQAEDIQRPATLYWGGRRPSDLYLNDWVIELQKSLPLLRYIPVISDALPEDNWSGRTGFVHQAVLDDFENLSAYQVYACGAPVVVESAHHSFVEQRGLPPEEFYADSFITEKEKHSGKTIA